MPVREPRPRITALSTKNPSCATLKSTTVSTFVLPCGQYDLADGRRLRRLGRIHEIKRPTTTSAGSFGLAAAGTARRGCISPLSLPPSSATRAAGWGIGAVDSISLGIEKMCVGLAGLEKTGTMLALPGFYLLLAQLHARNANFDGAREALHKAAGREGQGTRIWSAEVERIRGVILASRSYPDLDAAEAAYRSSLHIARQQKARSLELRTAVSYARLLERLDRRQEGHDLLKGCLARVTEGKTTEDVHAALAAIEALADEPPST